MDEALAYWTELLEGDILILFNTEREAIRAPDDLEGRSIDGRRLSIRVWRSNGREGN